MALTPALVAQTVHDRERMLAGIEHDIPADLAARIRDRIDRERVLLEQLLPAEKTETIGEDTRTKALPDEYFVETPFPDFL